MMYVSLGELLRAGLLQATVSERTWTLSQACLTRVYALLLKTLLPVRASVCLPVGHTGEPRANGSR